MTKPSDNCTTPKEFFEVCNHLWGPFTIDVAANCYNRLVKRWCGECDCELTGVPCSPLIHDGHDQAPPHDLSCQPVNSNGLLHDWRDEVVWCNPPYSNPRPWVAKAPTAKRCVMLLKADTSTAWWRDAIALAGEVLFLKKRLVFGGYGGGKNSAKFPNVLVVWNSEDWKRQQWGKKEPLVDLSWDWEADLARWKK